MITDKTNTERKDLEKVRKNLSITKQPSPKKL